jgi:hypothetical protein
MKLLGLDLFIASTTQKNELGIIVEDTRGGEQTFTFNDILPVESATGGIAASPTTRRFDGGGIYKYCQLNGTVVAGDAVKIDTTATQAKRHATVIQTTAADEAFEGIAMAGGVSGQFIWVQIMGKMYQANVANAANSVGQALSPTATAGRLGTITTQATYEAAQYRSRGVYLIAAPSSNIAEVYIQR